jgi:sugar phosphate isomerase/epimerase
MISRRNFAKVTAAVALTPTAMATAGTRPSLERVVGITTGGLNHQRENKMLDVMSLPRFLRDELGMQLIDLNTRWLTAFDDQYIGKVRENAEKAGCYFSNLKVNHRYGSLTTGEPAGRRKAMEHSQKLVRVAQRLGARWMRFSFPKTSASAKPAAVQPYRELAIYAEERGVQLLVENGGWLKSDPDGIPRMVKLIGRNLAPAPDTGNWDDDSRWEGLKKAFPGAVTCDFKVFELNDQRQHERYDIRRCFDIGWQAGFRGPWAIEHWNDDSKKYARDTGYLRDQLVKWMKEKK